MCFASLFKAEVVNTIQLHLLATEFMTGGCLQDLSTGHCSQMHLPCTAHIKGAAQICSVVARNLLNRRVYNEFNTEKPSEALLTSFPGCSHVYLQYLITHNM